MVSQDLPELDKMNFKSAAVAMHIQDKPMVVFLHTDWCPYYHAMENTTLTDAAIIKLLNNSFYYIPCNAESCDNATLNSKIFKFRPSGKNKGLHEMATPPTFYQNKPTFPSLFVINSDFEIIYETSGFIDAAQLRQILEKISGARIFKTNIKLI
jgi:thioredoxin-related protein